MSTRKLLLNCRLNSFLKQATHPVALQTTPLLESRRLSEPTFALLLPHIPLPTPLSISNHVSGELWFVEGRFLRPSEFPINSVNPLLLLNSIALVALLLPPPPIHIGANS